MRIPAEILICPECKQPALTSHAFQREGGEGLDGVLSCEACKNWFIVEDNILELLKTDLNKDRRNEFFHKYEKSFKDLNLDYIKTEDPTTTQEINQKKTQVDFYKELSDIYPLESQSFWLAYYKMTVHEFSKNAKFNSTILDIGCGTGLGTLPFLNGNHAIVGIDISRDMLKKAMNLIPESHKSRHFYFVADAENLPFKQNTFDYCIGMGILHHVTHPQKVIASAYNCLKKGGIYFGHENNKSFLRPLFDLLMKIFRLWNEEAGEEQLFSIQRIRSLYANFRVEVKTHVFLPPHVFNLFKPETAYKFLKGSDFFFSLIPLLKNHGGTIVFKAQKY